MPEVESPMGDVAVIGASGLIGAATVGALLEQGSVVTAVSRRRPDLDSGHTFTHVALDLLDRSACADVIDKWSSVTHLVYAAAYEKPGLVTGWSDPEQMATNLSMFGNVLEPLARLGALQHVSVMQGTKAYGVHLHPIPLPAKESAPRDPHPNFYWLQEDLLKQLSTEHDFGWTIMRPVQVVGPAYGSGYCTPPVIGAYAAICREEGLPFAFPGGNIFPARQVADVRLVANALCWAATSPAALGQHFNLTNGEVFSWTELWPVFAEFFGIEAAKPTPLSMTDFLSAKADVWDAIVARYGLRKLSLAEILGHSHQYADYTFGYGITEMPPPALVSTVKVKQAGYTATMDTAETFGWALSQLVERGILPGRQGSR
jgi:nucleoside-diphosphate-sugar epimerase